MVVVDGARWAVDRQRKVELLAKQHLEELLAEIAAGADSTIERKLKPLSDSCSRWVPSDVSKR